MLIGACTISNCVCPAFVGFLFFFGRTYLKFPDEWVEHTRSSQTFGFAKSNTTYGFADAVMLWLVYFAIVVFLSIMSLGQRAAYCYPMKPVTVLGKDKKEEELRGHHRAELTLFLAQSCHIPTCENENTFKQQTFLTNVGGGHVNEAEVIADALLDAGIMSIFEFKTFVAEGEGMVFDCPGISIGAATQISWEFQFGKARHDVACFEFLYNEIKNKKGEIWDDEYLANMQKLHKGTSKIEEGNYRSQLKTHLTETRHINTHEKWLDDIAGQLGSLIKINKDYFPASETNAINPGFGI